jgi:hypothetical protein
VALTSAQIYAIRRWVGETPDDTALNDAYDRLGNTQVIILEVLETRLANLEAEPASFNVPGEYGQSTAQNIVALRETLARLRAQIDPTVDTTSPFQTGVRILYPEYEIR